MALNYKRYEGKGIFPGTGRIRTINGIDAFDEEEVKSVLLSKGLVEPYEIKVVPFEPATDPQIEYAKKLKIKVSPDMTKIDLMYLIDKTVEHDGDPKPGLIQFATDKKIKLSDCVGKRALYDLVWNNLDERDKIAFFSFSVYRWLSNDREADLNLSPHKDSFYKFADEKINDTRFVTSMKKYRGDELRFFGKQKIEDDYHYKEVIGGSEQTIAYKETAAFLRNEGLIHQETITKNFAKLNERKESRNKNSETRNTENNAVQNNLSKSQCIKASVFLAILSVLFIIAHMPKIVIAIPIVLAVMCILASSGNPSKNGQNNNITDQNIKEILSDDDIDILIDLYDEYKFDKVNYIKEFSHQTKYDIKSSKLFVDYILNHKGDIS